MYSCPGKYPCLRKLMMLDEKKIICRDAKIMTSCMYNKEIVELSMAYSILFKKKKFFIKTYISLLFLHQHQTSWQHL